MIVKRLSLKCLVSFALIFQIMICCPLYGADQLLPGTTLPKFKMKTPEDPVQSKYLGIEGEKKFTLSKIAAKLVIVEFFNVFCPKCHAQAPKANQIYNLIEGNQELKQDVKMLAVGLLAKPEQMAAYQQKYNIPFPLIPDEDGEVIQILRISAIPQTLVLDQKGKVLANHLGVIDDVDAFLLETRKFLKQQ